MSLKDYAVMPLSDYVDACDAIRTKTETTESIKSADLKDKILSIKSESAQFACGTNTWGGTTAKTYTLSGLSFRPKVVIYSAPTKDDDAYNYFSSLLIDTVNGINKLMYLDTSGSARTITTENTYFAWGINNDGFYITLKTSAAFLWKCSSIEKPWVCIG